MYESIPTFTHIRASAYSHIKILTGFTSLSDTHHMHIYITPTTLFGISGQVPKDYAQKYTYVTADLVMKACTHIHTSNAAIPCDLKSGPKRLHTFTQTQSHTLPVISDIVHTHSHYL